MSDDIVSEDFADFSATLSLTDPVKDYQKLINEKIMIEHLYVPDEMREDIWDKISAGARDAVWMLLFSETNPTVDALDKAAVLLKKYKYDAVYYSPCEYNDWIILVRDELLNRKMFDFWKNVVVSNSMGPAWARDLDFFDNMDDPEPAAFYSYAGCMAPWL